MRSVPFFTTVPTNGSYNGSYTVPTRFLQFLQKPTIMEMIAAAAAHSCPVQV